ncbi:prophage regulatory protein [Paraburkholderia sp. WC7.3g]
MPDQIMNDSRHELSILRLPDVIQLTGLSRSTIYAAVSAQAFPRQVRLSARCVGWFEHDIQSWLLTRVQAA